MNIQPKILAYDKCVMTKTIDIDDNLFSSFADDMSEEANTEKEVTTAIESKLDANSPWKKFD